jgi:hypothetical protein
MKRALPCVLALSLTVSVWAQSDTRSEQTTVTTREHVMPSDFYLLRELWSVKDAVPIPCGQLDLRLTGQWITAGAPANRGDSGDDFIITPGLVWGAADDFELFLNVPVWVGSGGEIPGIRPDPITGGTESGLDGNADAYLGFLWRFADQVDYWPAAALQFTGRFPTGVRSSGIDVEGRLILTNEYDSGLRSHLNVWGTSANGDNFEELRHFQYGGSIGVDGPLAGDDLRWVLDYMYVSSRELGNSGTNLADVGWQWRISDVHNLGMSVQIGLDHSDDEAPNFGAKVTYAYALTY